MTESMTPHEARAALSSAAEAARAARGPRPVPAWLPPSAAVLYAAGFVSLALLSDHPGSWGYLVAAVVALALFLVLMVAGIRAGSVVPAPSGSAARRTAVQALSLTPLAVGGLAAIPFGITGFTAVIGVGFGIVAWVRLDGYRKGERA